MRTNPGLVPHAGRTPDLMPVTVRRAGPGDAGDIVRRNLAIARDTESMDLDPGRLREGVRRLLEDPSKGFYLVAELDGRPAGQLMITFEWSDWRNGVFWWIQSVFVEPEARRKGVFGALYRHVTELARAADPPVCGLRLYVEAGNGPALRAYESAGMRRAPYQVWEVDFVLARPGPAAR